MSTMTDRPVSTPTAESMQAPRSRAMKERLFAALLFVATTVGIVVLGVLLVDILSDGASRLSWDFITSYSSRFADKTGILAGLTGSLSLMVLVALIAFPVGVAAAVYLEEFAPDNWFTRLMQVNISNLAGVPSIVYGLLTLSIFVYALGFGRSLMSGAMALVLLILPVIIVSSREAIRAVPRAIREGGLGLGATPLQVTRKLVLPQAVPGIMTGTILALSRAIGEAAPILVAGAAFSRRTSSVPWEPLEGFVALPIQIFNFVSRPQREFQVEVAAAGIIVLLIALLTMNTVAIVVRNRYSR